MDIAAVKAAGTSAAILAAASRVTKHDGQGDASKILQGLAKDPVGMGAQLQAAASFKSPEMMSLSEAAALILQLNLTVAQ